eukprot:Hpha_TRINITY_DN15055_c4_g10::TRINITY_DN15055_c4_g10_i1::g.126253::m.126253
MAREALSGTVPPPRQEELNVETTDGEGDEEEEEEEEEEESSEDEMLGPVLGEGGLQLQFMTETLLRSVAGGEVPSPDLATPLQQRFWSLFEVYPTVLLMWFPALVTLLAEAGARSGNSAETVLASSLPILSRAHAPSFPTPPGRSRELFRAEVGVMRQGTSSTSSSSFSSPSAAAAVAPSTSSSTFLPFLRVRDSCSSVAAAVKQLHELRPARVAVRVRWHTRLSYEGFVSLVVLACEGGSVIVIDALQVGSEGLASLRPLMEDGDVRKVLRSKEDERRLREAVAVAGCWSGVVFLEQQEAGGEAAQDRGWDCSKRPVPQRRVLSEAHMARAMLLQSPEWSVLHQSSPRTGSPRPQPGSREEETARECVLRWRQAIAQEERVSLRAVLSDDDAASLARCAAAGFYAPRHLANVLVPAPPFLSRHLVPLATQLRSWADEAGVTLREEEVLPENLGPRALHVSGEMPVDAMSLRQRLRWIYDEKAEGRTAEAECLSDEDDAEDPHTELPIWGPEKSNNTVMWEPERRDDVDRLSLRAKQRWLDDRRDDNRGTPAATDLYAALSTSTGNGELPHCPGGLEILLSVSDDYMAAAQPLPQPPPPEERVEAKPA